MTDQKLSPEVGLEITLLAAAVIKSSGEEPTVLEALRAQRLAGRLEERPSDAVKEAEIASLRAQLVEACLCHDCEPLRAQVETLTRERDEAWREQYKAQVGWAHAAAREKAALAGVERLAAREEIASLRAESDGWEKQVRDLEAGEVALRESLRFERERIASLRAQVETLTQAIHEKETALKIAEGMLDGYVIRLSEVTRERDEERACHDCREYRALMETREKAALAEVERLAARVFDLECSHLDD